MTMYLKAIAYQLCLGGVCILHGMSRLKYLLALLSWETQIFPPGEESFPIHLCRLNELIDGDGKLDVDRLWRPIVGKVQVEVWLFIKITDTLNIHHLKKNSGLSRKKDLI